MQYITVRILLTKNGGVKHHIMMCGDPSSSLERIVEKNEARNTHTISGPSFGTFSSPIICTSEKNDHIAQPARRRMTRCSTMLSDMMTVNRQETCGHCAGGEPAGRAQGAKGA